MVELFVLNTSIFVNVLKVAKSMAMNPIEDSHADFSPMLLFQEALDDETGEAVAADFKKRILLYFKMDEFEEPEVNVEQMDLTK